MERTGQVILVIGLIAVIVGAYFGLPYLLKLPHLAVYSYAQNVPVDNMQYSGSYWIIGSVIRESQAFKLVLNKGSSESGVKTASEVGLLINPLAPYSKTNMLPADIRWTYQTMTGKQEKAPAYDVNGANWLTTVAYEVGVFKNTIQVGETRPVEFDYTKRENFNVDINTGEGVVTIKNLGQLPQGVSVPTGDYVVVYDPDGTAHIFLKVDFLNMIQVWNDKKMSGWVSPITGLYANTWKDVWDLSTKWGTLPQDQGTKLSHVENWQISANKDAITLTYREIEFAGDIAIYIPADLADTVVIVVKAAKPKIVKVEPDELPEVDEGKKASFSVTIKNEGDNGTIGVSPTSDRYLITATTPSFKNMKAGETVIFGFEAYALNTESDTGYLYIKIATSGEGGSDVYNYRTKGIKDVPGYTPPTPTPTSATLIIYVKDAMTFQGISDVPITILYGSQTRSALSSSDGSISFDLGSYTGSVQVKASATESYGEKTETAEVKLGKNEHTILLGASWIGQYWWLLLLVAIIVVAVIVAVIWWVKRD